MRGSRGHEPIDDAIDGTPPGEPETPGLLDAEFDALFTPVRDNNKRRRLSAGERPTPEDKLNYQSETMPSSPPELLQQRVHKTPAPRPVPKGTGIQAISSASAGPIPSGVSTPGSIKTPFRSKPRFMFAAKKPPSSQTPFKADTHTASQPTSPPERRKPTFVLPRSPSPNAAAEDVPVPFSPSSRTLHRRGRRSGVPGYTPGGMAAEVRSWILEVGSKREHAVPSRTTVHASGTSFEDLSQYLVAARVVHASQTALSSSGALAFIQAESVSCPTGERESSEHINVMAMGPPRSKPDSGQLSTRTRGIQTVILRAGDLVGIHRGLAWEVEFLEFQALGAAHGLRSGASERDDQESRKQRWLVAMEWDLIQVAD